jgi:hypothetical protein
MIAQMVVRVRDQKPREAILLKVHADLRRTPCHTFELHREFPDNFGSHRPRPPRGGRHDGMAHLAMVRVVSIHAPRGGRLARASDASRCW